MSRPAKSRLVDDALDPAVASPDNIKLNAIQITMIGTFEWSKQWIDITHSRILDSNRFDQTAATARSSL
jgi:hypothetical protein